MSDCQLLHSEQGWRVVIAWTWTPKDLDLVTRFGEEVLQSDHWAMGVKLVYKQVIKTLCSGGSGGWKLHTRWHGGHFSVICPSVVLSTILYCNGLLKHVTHPFLGYSCDYFFQVFCGEVKLFLMSLCICCWKYLQTLQALYRSQRAVLLIKKKEYLESMSYRIILNCHYLLWYFTGVKATGCKDKVLQCWGKLALQNDSYSPMPFTGVIFEIFVFG